MRLGVALFVTLCLRAVCSERAAAQDRIEVFGGYSFVHASAPTTTTIGTCPITGCPIINVDYHPNLNGWEAQGTFKTGHWLGFTRDFSGHYGKIGGANVHLQTFLFGPTVTVPGRISPFVHVLLGGAHETVGNGSVSGSFVAVPTSGNWFALAAGGGLDIKVLPHVAIRPIQIDYLAMRAYSTTQNQPRISAGVVLRL